MPLQKIRVASCLLLLASLPLLHADALLKPDIITPDGGHYYGRLVDGTLQGQGRIEWKSGARYEGAFDKGLFSGKGKYKAANNYTYEGDFDRGIMSGRGRMVFRDGSIYVGEFRKDDFNGQGRYQMASGEVYEGSFENGLFHGRGKLAGAERTYQGQFKSGRFDGHGELIYKGGRKYVGEFAGGQYQGKGRFETPDGQVYEGDFDKDALTGKGTLVRKDGSRYSGSFRDWNYNGEGTFTDPQGTVFTGHFLNGELTGAGTMTGKHGGRYDGEFKQWRMHGKGVLHLPNGDTYKGGFANGQYEGEGTLTYATAEPDGHTSEHGVWHEGYLEDKLAERQTRINVETALYNQRRLLDAALSTLTPQDPAKIDLYLLAVGGTGSQEVFHREVDFVRKKFDREFGTRGHSLMLVNSRNTLKTEPMATLTSLRESLQAIAGRMDKENDILFLFLTSHGSKDHEFALDQSGMDLPGLQAAELGTMLRETGIRWKVVVISACYSGGFIDLVKDDHTLVITAARHDRTSFGCSDDNDFTYFGRAYFKEALNGTTSFEDAFTKAKSLVEKWEAEDIKVTGDKSPEAHSLPQMNDPVAIRAYLQQWRAQLAVARGTAVAKNMAGVMQRK